MKKENINSNQILFLSILCGLFLIVLQLTYIMGREEGLLNTLNAFTEHIPIYITVLLCCFSAGMSLRHLHLKKINLSTKQYYIIIILCMLLFPIGLFFMFGKKKIFTLNA